MSSCAVGVATPSATVTYARTVSPCTSSWMPITPTSATDGCSASAPSTSYGLMFEPSCTMICFFRPKNQR